MKNSILTLCLMLIPLAGFGQSFALKANGGSLGLGLEGSTKLHERVNIRVGANFLNAGYFYETGNEEEFDVDASLRLGNYTAMVDWHVFNSSFRLSGGVIYNNNAITTDLLPKQSYNVGGDTYSPEDLGTLTAEMTFNPVAPFVSLGFGNTFKGSPFGVNLELGVFFQGSPRVSMQADGLLGPSAEQAPILQRNLEWFDAYPVLTLSMYYRIF